MSQTHRIAVSWAGSALCLLSGCMNFLRTDVPVSPDAPRPDTRISATATPDSKDSAATLPDPPPQPVVGSDYSPRPVTVPIVETKLLSNLDKPDPDAQPLTTFPLGNSLPSVPPPESPLVAALRCAVEKNPEEAGRLLEKYGKHERDLLLRLMCLTAGMKEKSLEKLSPQDISATLEQLQALNAVLRARATLSLDRLTFCRKIEGFGRIEPMEAGHEFQAGGDGKHGEYMQVYTEVRNFTSRPTDADFKTELACTVEIADSDDKRVASIDLGTSTDQSRSPRQDYYLNLGFHLPADLRPGRYSLRLTVRDLAGEAAKPRVAHLSMPFRVGTGK